MHILSEEEIQKHYQMENAIADVESGLQTMNRGNIDQPHRTVIGFPNQEASILYMPSANHETAFSGMKTVSIFPENKEVGKKTTQGVLLLTDSSNGEHVCLMNASYLTRVRTGALSGIATKKLAKKDARILGVIGTGGMAFEQVLGVLAVRNIEKIILFNPTMEKAYSFREKLLQFGVEQPIKVVDHVDAVLASADIVNCATRSNVPVFTGESLLPGTHINGVGSYLPTMREVDGTTIQRASKIVVDDREGARKEAGELIHAAKQTEWSFQAIYGELRDLMEKPFHRENQEEITFFKSVGAAYFDMAVAEGIYQKAVAEGFGRHLTV